MIKIKASRERKILATQYCKKHKLYYFEVCMFCTEERFKKLEVGLNEDRD